MSTEERSLIRALYIGPRREPMPKDQFLREFGAADGVVLGLGLLRDAVDRQDSLDVELALTVCFTFDITDGHLPLLITLAFAGWHRSHEDVASALQDIGSPESVDACLHLAMWVPAYLQTDEAQALAVKAIWALGGIGTDAARWALESLAGSPSAVVADNAVAQLRK